LALAHARIAAHDYQHPARDAALPYPFHGQRLYAVGGFDVELAPLRAVEQVALHLGTICASLARDFGLAKVTPEAAN